MPKRYIPNDKWSQRAAEMGYRARSVFKLEEIDERVRLLKPGIQVLDLGASPGSWLQYTSKKIGPTGRVIGLDLTEIKKVAPNVVTRVCDIMDDEAVQKVFTELQAGMFDVILSDIAPNTTGIKDIDQFRSVELSRRAMALSIKHLKLGGWVVLKIFRGGDFDGFLQQVKRQCPNAKPMTVKASRDRSKEVYVVGKYTKLPNTKNIWAKTE